MRLLLTNDDGIDSLFLHVLVRALRTAGHDVVVVAPQREQSWIGAAKSRHRPVTSARVDRDLHCPTWMVDGTPSDCVNIALAHLLPKAGVPRPEAVISGINIGMNASLGFILASGTIGGAWEGALHGLPAIAVSQDLTLEAFDRVKSGAGQADEILQQTLHNSARRTAEMAESLLKHTEPGGFIVHNLNYPYAGRADAPVQRTVPAHVIVPGLFSPAADDGTHRFVFQIGQDVSPAHPLSDRAALAAGLVSHTILDYRLLGHASRGASNVAAAP